MSEKEMLEILQPKKISNENLELLKENFFKEFNTEYFVTDLMELIDKDKLKNFLRETFNENFSYEELYELFRNQLNKDELKELLEELDHDFIDLETEEIC